MDLFGRDSDTTSDDEDYVDTESSAPDVRPESPPPLPEAAWQSAGLCSRVRCPTTTTGSRTAGRPRAKAPTRHRSRLSGPLWHSR